MADQNFTSPGLASRIWSHPVVFGTRKMFYLLTPGEASFEHVNSVPAIVDQAVPFFLLFIIIEMIILTVQGKRSKGMRGNDALSSVMAGIISQMPLILVRNIEMSAYIWVHKNYCVAELPWDSPYTWWLCMLGTDLGYYWVHRMAHEINFMWAGHQVHHSSEDYNLSTALRQSVLQRYSSWVFYLPMALFIPAPVFLVHIQLNLIYQFWIHTEIVDRLGPLELILNTPSHHRVHHGRNRYCIDKNYAGVLIIWDRIFGTFVAEDKDDTIAYGLVHSLESWDPIYTQYCHWKHILQTAMNAEGLGNKVSTFIKGPGWTPGKPRLGLIEDIPDIHGPVQKYNRCPTDFWINIYAWGHFFLILISQQLLALEAKKPGTSYAMIVLGVMFGLWTITNIGFLYEMKSYGPVMEVARCVAYLAMDIWLCGGADCTAWLYALRAVFVFSAVLQLAQCAKVVTGRSKKLK